MKREFFNLYGIRFIVSGDVDKARSLAYQARRMHFQRALVGVPRLKLNYPDGSVVQILRQAGQDFASIYVPEFQPKQIVKKRIEPIREIIPWFYVSYANYGDDGLMVCHGGLSFGGWYEFFKPYADNQSIFGSIVLYQPYEYIPPQGDSVLLEWQVKKYWGEPVVYNQPTYWNEFQWMTDNWKWDPVYWETYQDYLDAVDIGMQTKPYGVTMEESDWGFVYGDPWQDIEDATNNLVVNGESILETKYSVWNTPGDGYGGRYWFSGTVIIENEIEYCIDQADPSKYFIFYVTAGGEGESALSPWWGSSALKDGWDYMNLRCFGLGHDVAIPSDGVLIENFSERSRLFKIGDKYIFLSAFYFEDNAGGHKFLLSVTDDSEYNLVDITDGFVIGNETYDLFPNNNVPISVGMIERYGYKEE